MKITSWNINGIAAHRKDLIKSLSETKPDIMCIQETRGETALNTTGYHSFWFSAAKPNYSGTLVLTKFDPLSVKLGIGIKKYDREGRAITLEYEDFYIVNVYVPNYQAQSPPERRPYRLNWDGAFRTYISKLPKPVVIMGDFNVTHTDMDIYPSEARTNTVPPDMITEERLNFERLLDLGLKDVFRMFYPQKRDAYTWWAPKNDNRIHNKGSRLDYFLVSDELTDYVKSVKHYTNTQGSDHCPISLIFKPVLPQKEPSVEELAEKWDNTDWIKITKEVFDMQRSIAQAAYNLDWALVSQLQDKLTSSWSAKALVVYKVANSGSAPGVDGVVWRTSIEKARAVQSLNSHDYTPLPYLRMEIKESNGKQRNINVAVYRDRAMIMLYALSLSPVAETTSDKKSFFARKFRSKLDLHAYLFDALNGSDAPKIVLLVDVMAFYESVLHCWFLEHIHMNTEMLRKFLKAGVVRNDELFDTEKGMSMGISISPILGNLLLDGLQSRIYDRLYPGTQRKKSYHIGELFRWADDMLITANTWSQAEQILQIVTDFLAERGLNLNQEKTRILKVENGFTFLSRVYRKVGNALVVNLSHEATMKHVKDLEDLILGDTDKKVSPETMISRINGLNKSWANHYRDIDAYKEFCFVDAAVNTFLLHRLKDIYSPSYHKQMEKRFWVTDDGNRSVFVCPTDRSIRVVRLAQNRIVRHKPCKVSINPYFDQEYYKWIHHYRDVQKANGNYRIVWDRQKGMCAYCGDRILADQEVDIIERIVGKGRKLDNLIYVHKRCAYDAYRVYGGCESSGSIDLIQLLQDYIEDTSDEDDLLTEESPYIKLTDFFQKCEQRSVTLTFTKIEEILEKSLPVEAYQFQVFWYETSFDLEVGQRNKLWKQDGFPIHAVELSLPDYCISDSWIKYGYKINIIDFEKEKINFQRGSVLRGTARRAFRKVLQVEQVLMGQKLSIRDIKKIDALLEQITQELGL